MKIAVTGAAGFIGQNLCEYLTRAGQAVVGADQFPGRYVTTDVDLSDPAAAAAWVDKQRPDVLVHLAAQVGRVFGEDDIAWTVAANAGMTAVLAQAASDAGARMVYASSSEVYGDHGGDIITEQTAPRMPKNLYGLSKRWGEEACQLYAPADLVVLRLSMPYGPGVAPGRGRRAMDTFLWQAHHDLPITAYRGTERSWCWIGDTVRAIAMVIGQPDGGIWNIGRDDDPISMEATARLARIIAGRDPDKRIVTPAPGPFETPTKRISMRRLYDLGWRPTIDLVAGMREVYEWVRQYDINGDRLVGR